MPFQLHQLALVDFLSPFPEPAFLLSASHLAAILLPSRATSRGSPPHPTEFEPQPRRPYPARDASSAAADAAHVANGDESQRGEESLLSGRRELSQSSQLTRSSSNDAAGQILSEAWEDDAETEARSTRLLLEGGTQLPHDPSRTAEGAVLAMQEQNVIAEKERERVRDVRIEQEQKLLDDRDLFYVAPRVESKVGLADHLEPVWSNSSFHRLVEPIGDGGARLSLLALLSREDGQRYIDLLTEALDPADPRVDPDLPPKLATTTLHLHFPAESIHGNATSPLHPPPQCTLEIVATHVPAHDLLVLTTTARDVPPRRRPSLKRPGISTRISTLSSISTVTQLPGTPTPPSPSVLATPTPSSPAVPVPVLVPFSETSSFGVATAAPELTNEDYVAPFPEGFVVEKLVKRKARRFERKEAMSRISIKESPKSSTLRPALATGRRQSIEELVAARSDSIADSLDSLGELNEADGDGDESDEMLDLLRARTRTGSVTFDNVFSQSTKLDVYSPDSSSSDPSTSPDTSVPSTSPPEGIAPLVLTSSDPFLDSLRTPMGVMVRNFDWSATPLGPIKSWSRELKLMVSLIMASPMREAIFFGDASTIIYNDEYVKIAGARHPRIFGKSGAEAWVDLWSTLGPLAARVMRGETISEYDQHLPIVRNGRVQEEYHVYSFIPIRGPTGLDGGNPVIAFLNPSFSTTTRVIAERRLATIRDLVAVTSLARTTNAYYEKTLSVLATNPHDMPFVICYSCESQETATMQGRTETGSRTHQPTSTTGWANPVPLTSTMILTLKGSIGVPENHPSAPAKIQLTTSDSVQSHTSSSSATSDTTSGTGPMSDPATIWPFLSAITSRKPVFIGELAGRNKGFTLRGWPDEARHALLIPVLFDGDVESLPKAILIVGLNPRRPWNTVYATFFNLLSRQLASGLYASTSAEQDHRKAAELLALDKAKTSFFSNISHELRTPLTLILGPLDDVLSGKENLDPSDRERLVTVQRHSTRLLNMVNTLLDFSRLEGGKMEASFRAVQLGSMTSDLASLFRSAIERGGVKYVVDCEPDPTDGQPIYLAPEFWEKILFNLIGNAFKYCLEGTITVKVRFAPDSAVVSIEDTGCGIAESELGKIFQRFHRVEAVSRTYEGTGIGLALTLELVNTIGGNLEVESELGKGSTFTVRLPRGSMHLPSDRIRSNHEANAHEPPLPPRARYDLSIIEEASSWQVLRAAPSPAVSAASSSRGDDSFLGNANLLDLQGSTILLADDNEDLRRYIAGTLSKAFKVVQVTNGQDALEYALQNPPSLVVSDVQMPRLDGRGLLAALRANPATAMIPVIFLSAHAGAEARVEALLQGADDYLVKPFQSRELLARCNIHLQLGKMRIELERRVEERTKALVESEIRYRGLADRYSTLSVLSPVGIFMTNEHGDLSYANPRWHEISGHPVDQLLSEWRQSVLPEDLPLAEEAWNNAILAGPSLSARGRHAEFRWRQGNTVQLEIRPFHESGENQGFVGAITDITHQKKVEALHIQAVEQRAADAEENRRQQELFIDMASHELRNPLSGVWQNAEVVSGSLERITDVFDEIRSGNLPEQPVLDEISRELHENIEAVESIILCTSHQSRIADDILSVSKLSMGLLSVLLQPFDLAAKMNEVLRMFEVECSQKQIKLTLKKEPSVTALKADWIVADASRLAQILINFLTNSVKYTSDSTKRAITVIIRATVSPPSPTPLSLRVGAQANVIDPIDPDKVWIIVGVQDSGKGLSGEDMKKLFARFSQANPKTDQYGGAGLGLFVCRSLIELHSGYIEVESRLGQGSTFSFAIPAARATPPLEGSPPIVLPSRVVPVSMRSTTKRSTDSPVKTSRPSTPVEQQSNVVGTPYELPTAVHVLVVEDNLINQKVMQRQLKLQNYTVTVANHGQEALEILLAQSRLDPSTETPISIVLMDIEMPVMDGLTAIRELRQAEREGKLARRYPVIAVTGNARTAQQEACLESGFDDVAIKPYRMQELLVQIGRLLA